MAEAAGARPNDATIKQSDEKMATAGGEVKKAARARGGRSGAMMDLIFGTNFLCPRWNRTEPSVGSVAHAVRNVLALLDYLPTIL